MAQSDGRRTLAAYPFSVLCFKPSEAVELDARYDERTREWIITYAIKRKGFEGLKIEAWVGEHLDSGLRLNKPLVAVVQPMRDRHGGACVDE